MSEYKTRANTYTCPEDGCRGCEGCYGEDDTAECACCDYVFEGPTGFAEHDTWYCRSCDIRACAGCIGEDDPYCEGCGLVFEHTSGPFDDDGNYIGNAEEKNCGCGQDPCITYGAEKTVPLNYTPDIAPYAGVFEKMEVTFKIQDADYATFYYTTEIPSGLRRHSDEHIVSYIWGDECEPQDDNWFYCP